MAAPAEQFVSTALTEFYASDWWDVSYRLEKPRTDAEVRELLCHPDRAKAIIKGMRRSVDLPLEDVFEALSRVQNCVDGIVIFDWPDN